jgi:predicted AlkP superfamily phosphohydrolase/phosphomutase
MNKRLFVIGIDSAPKWIIKKLSSKYKLKGFLKFIDSGTLENLESTIPPLTPVAWPSIYTGLDPSIHGVTNFFKLNKDYTKELIYYDTKRHPPFWEILARNGVKCLIVTPATVVQTGSSNVDIITGFPLKPRYSSNKLKNAAKKSGFYGEPEIEEGLRQGTLKLSEATKIYSESIKNRSEMTKNLITSGKYGFSFICFTEIDRIQHYTLNMRNWEDFVEPLYRHISQFIEWLISWKNPEDVIMLVSDHGAQGIRSKFMLNAWLINNNYASIKRTSEKPNPYETSNLENNKASRNKLEQINVSSKTTVMKFICASVVENDIEETKDTKTLDMKSTKAFASLTNNPFGSIWINDSRFISQRVTEKERNKLKKEIIKKMLAMKDDEGKKLVTELYDAKKSKDNITPDIIFKISDGHTIDIFNYSGSELFSVPEPARNGDHTREGIFGLYPNSFKHSKYLKVVDIFEMILSFYGINNKEG